MKWKRTLLLGLALLLTGCAEPQAESPRPTEPLAEVSVDEGAEQPPPPGHEQPAGYVVSLADALAARLVAEGMTEAEKAKAAYDYIIANTVFDQPVGLDIWRIRTASDPNTPIPYLENRALSPLAFGIGSCEDYAAALALLLRQMGLEARYLPGITLSVDGDFVDHAWTVAKIDGEWYHLDCQLEDNILKDDTIVYRYFMRSDQAMMPSHRWSEYLIDYGGLTPDRVEEIRGEYMAPACPVNYPTPEPNRIRPANPPNREALEAELQGEIARWEAQNGPLREIVLDTVPPVFWGEVYPLPGR